MTQRIGISVQNEIDTQGVTGPVEAYLMDHPTVAGRYILGRGNKVGEATAFLVDQGSGLHTLDDDVAEEDRKIYSLSTSTVVII